MSSVGAAVVPANRLGQLLVEARQREGADLEDLAKRSGFTVGELSDFEAGHRVLNDSLVSEITALYALDCGPIIPQRTTLTIDLNENLLVTAGHALPLTSQAHDHVLERYLSLLYVLRDRDPGTRVSLRDEDLDILAASLAERRELIEEQLLRAMDPERDSVRGLAKWFRGRLWVPGAGLFVGAVSIGTLIMVSDSAVSSSSASELPEPGDGEPSRTPPLALITDGNTRAVSEASLALGAEAEAMLPFSWQELLPDWNITYLDAHPEFRGLTYPYDKSIDMFVREDDTAESLAGILAHEIAHAIDVEHFGNDERNEWREARGIEDAAWWPDAYARDFETGAGDFAESFAFWAVGDPSSSELGSNPSQAQLNVIEALLANL